MAGELRRGERAFAMEVLVLVTVLPGERGGRGAQVDGQHPPGVLESLLSSRSNPGVPVVGTPGSTDLTDDAAHDLLQGSIHAVGVARGLGVGHGPLWHEAVLADDVDELRPVTTIAQFAEQLTHLLVAVGQINGLHGSGKGEVDLLDLVEEGDVVL